MAVVLKELSGNKFEPPNYSNSYHRNGHGTLGGDLTDRDFRTISEILTHNARLTHYAVQEHLQNTGEMPQAVWGKILEYHDQINKFREHVNNPDNYSPAVDLTVIKRYKQADGKTVGKSMLERIAERLKTTNGNLLHLTDVDGTITRNPNDYLELIPGGSVAEPILKQEGHGALVNVLARTRRGIVKEAPVAFRTAGKQPFVEIRDGVDRFLKGRKVIAISASFEDFVAGVFDQIPPDAIEEIEIWAVSADNVIAVDKGTVIEHIAKQNPYKAIVYSGDGKSDLPAADSPFVAYYNALSNSAFEDELKRLNLPYLPYHDFHEIVNNERELLSRCKMIS